MQSGFQKTPCCDASIQKSIPNFSVFPSFHPSSQLFMHRMKFHRIEIPSRRQVVVASTPHSPDPSLGDWLISTSSPYLIELLSQSVHPGPSFISLLSSDLLLSLYRQSVVSSEGAVDRLVVVLSGLCDLLAELVEGTDVLLG